MTAVAARTTPVTTRLTPRVLKRLELGQTARDSVVRGLFAKAGPRGVSLKLQADFRPGERTGAPRARETLTMTLGRHPELSVEAARIQALSLLAEIRAGRDPRPQSAPPAPAPVALAVVLTCGEMFAAYLEHLRSRATPAAPRTIHEFSYCTSKYLAPLAGVPVLEVKPSQLRAEHERITRDHGGVVANKAMRLFSAAYNRLRDRADDPREFQDRITRAVEVNAESRREAVLLPEDLPGWFVAVGKIRNPLRREMHRLGLFSGLRPINLLALERAWIDLPGRAIVIPRERMKIRKKDRGDFRLALSAPMLSIVRRALASSERAFPGAPYLFPTWSRDGKRVIPTRVIREWAEGPEPCQLGHTLRHTWRTMALAAEVDPTSVELMLDHSIAGVAGTYLHSRALAEHLQKSQEKVSAHIIATLRNARRFRIAERTELECV
jgi:integrase